MVKREKRLEKSLISLKKQIEVHFNKLESDIKKGNAVLAGYHIKEIKRNLVEELERRMNLLGKVDKDVLEKYKKRLKELENNF